ncbi:MAG: hypothetical protein H6959_08910 [Chromatiaceae bacterium]|nr:hypothetical protein [Gammaproteobacteria bacterium]MCP5301465.1 hypothetical protein [Chromatiaceae bacterium]MCP5423029.1 hypothetical protein [Chromatiaceae bacterium]
MSVTQAPPAGLVSWLRQRRAAGDDGKTLLVGLIGADAAFALAAGLRGEEDHADFAVFARYLLHHRFGCDGHVLLLPVYRDDAAAYLVRAVSRGDVVQGLLSGVGGWQSWSGSIPVFDQLDVRAAPLPGLQRRTMDALFESIRVAPPMAEIAFGIPSPERVTPTGSASARPAGD